MLDSAPRWAKRLVSLLPLSKAGRSERWKRWQFWSKRRRAASVSDR